MSSNKLQVIDAVFFNIALINHVKQLVGETIHTRFHIIDITYTQVKLKRVAIAQVLIVI